MNTIKNQSQINTTKYQFIEFDRINGQSSTIHYIESQNGESKIETLSHFLITKFDIEPHNIPQVLKEWTEHNEVMCHDTGDSYSYLFITLPN